MRGNHSDYMHQALVLANKAYALGEVPVGAIVVKKDSGEIIGEGYNLRESQRHALAHAELMAIGSACRRLGGWRLPNCAMYVTLEPCPMCAGAMLQARIDEVYYGASDPKGGAVESALQLFAIHGFWSIEHYGGICEKECSTMLKDFFRELRLRKQTKGNVTLCG